MPNGDPCSRFPSMTSCEICGRQKGDMNATNWTRHVNSCKSKIPTSKTNLSSISIKQFFFKKQKILIIVGTVTDQVLDCPKITPTSATRAHPEVNNNPAEQTSLSDIGSYSMDIHNCTLIDQVLDSPNITSTTAHVEVNSDLVEQTSLSGRHFINYVCGFW
ncbi:hypothetical protein QTP88_015686 [Uroleucon formosanum]